MYYLIKDTDFEKIVQFLEEEKGIHTNHQERLIKFIETVYYLSRTGCQLRLLPYYYVHWRAIHKRFKEWSDRGIWERMFEYFKKDPDMEWVMIDSTIVRANACAAGFGKNS
jgi:transposase